MRIINGLTIHMTKQEVKEALMDYLIKNDKQLEAEHLKINIWDLDFMARQKHWVLSVRGEFLKNNQTPS